MVYYYEIVSKPLTAERLPQEVCPVCQKKGDIEVTLYMRYVSMLIPIFGMGRTTGIHCTNCGHEIKASNEPLFAKKNLSPEIKIAIQNIKATHRRTLWQLLYPWSLFLLLACLIGFGVVSTMFRKHTTANNKQLMENPKPGDIYKARLELLGDDNSLHSQYVLVKLLRINGDTMYIVPGKQSVQFGYSESDWQPLSRKDDAFESTEYKVSLKVFVYNNDPGDFITFKTGGSGNVDTDPGKKIGAVAGDNSGRMKVVERP